MRRTSHCLQLIASSLTIAYLMAGFGLLVGRIRLFRYSRGFWTWNVLVAPCSQGPYEASPSTLLSALRVMAASRICSLSASPSWKWNFTIMKNEMGLPLPSQLEDFKT